jgi:hypothetical protein
MLKIMMRVSSLQLMKMEANDTDELSGGWHQVCSNWPGWGGRTTTNGLRNRYDAMYSRKMVRYQALYLAAQRRPGPGLAVAVLGGDQRENAASIRYMPVGPGHSKPPRASRRRSARRPRDAGTGPWRAASRCSSSRQAKGRARAGGGGPSPGDRRRPPAR